VHLVSWYVRFWMSSTPGSAFCRLLRSPSYLQISHFEAQLICHFFFARAGLATFCKSPLPPRVFLPATGVPQMYSVPCHSNYIISISSPYRLHPERYTYRDRVRTGSADRSRGLALAHR
jgi:hypothetical protein